MAALEEPKKAPTAYFVFIGEKRTDLTKELGGKTPVGPFAKLVAAKWGALSEAERKPYEKKAEELKAKYEDDMAKFKDAGGQVGQTRKERAENKKARAEKAQKKARNADKPKRPACGACGCFMAEKRPEIMKTIPAGSPCTTLTTLCNEQWKKLSDSEKVPYEKLYEAKKKQYEEELQVWKESTAAAGEEAGDENADADNDEKDGGDAEETTPKKAKTEPPASGDICKCKAVADEAQQLGYTAKLKALMKKPQAGGMSAAKVLACLNEANGSTVVAKKALAAAGA